MSKIFIGCDHGAFELKQFLVKALIDKNYDVCDLGPKTADRVDYPDYAIKVGEAVVREKGSKGIVLCTTGVGIAIAANKVTGVRAAQVHCEDEALMSRRHNDANVIALGAKYISQVDALRFALLFIEESFEGGRHKNRVNKIINYENKDGVNQ